MPPEYTLSGCLFKLATNVLNFAGKALTHFTALVTLPSVGWAVVAKFAPFARCLIVSRTASTAWAEWLSFIMLQGAYVSRNLMAHRLLTVLRLLVCSKGILSCYLSEVRSGQQSFVDHVVFYFSGVLSWLAARALCFKGWRFWGRLLHLSLCHLNIDH